MVDLQWVIVAEFKCLLIIAELDYYKAVLKIKLAILRVSLKFLNRALLDLSANSLDFLNRHSQAGLVQQGNATQHGRCLMGLLTSPCWFSAFHEALRVMLQCSRSLSVSSWRKQWETKLPGSKEPVGTKNWYKKDKWAAKRHQLVQVSTVLCLQKCIWALQYLFCSLQNFSRQKLGKNGSQIWLSFFRTSPGSVLPAPGPGPVCRHVGSYTNDNLSWPLAVMSRCDSAVYLILIKYLTGVFWFCFAGRNHSYFQLCMLPLYLVVGTSWTNEQNLNWGNH